MPSAKMHHMPAKTGDPVCFCSHCNAYHDGVKAERERRDKAIEAAISKHTGVTSAIALERLRVADQRSLHGAERVLLAILEPGDKTT